MCCSSTATLVVLEVIFWLLQPQRPNENTGGWMARRGLHTWQLSSSLQAGWVLQNLGLLKRRCNAETYGLLGHFQKTENSSRTPRIFTPNVLVIFFDFFVLTYCSQNDSKNSPESRGHFRARVAAHSRAHFRERFWDAPDKSFVTNALTRYRTSEGCNQSGAN